MKEFYSQVNRKLYISSILIIIMLMVSGLVIAGTRLNQLEWGYVLHILLVIVLAIILLRYPNHETRVYRMIIIFLGFIYFYNLFFLYPETWSTFILICCIPASSILYFDSKLFYFSFVINGIFMSLTIGYIAFIDQGSLYPYLYKDIVGNIINLAASQVTLFLIFYLSFDRLKKQQLYYEQLQQSERLKMTGQLTAAVAHEIRNPLTVVKGFLQLHNEDPSINSATKSTFNLMIDELNVAEQVISQFLTLAKPNKDLKLEKVDVKEVLRSVTSLLNSYGMLHDNQIHINVEEDCYIAVNKIEFNQLIINLIKNAIEASGVGKSVSVIANRIKDSIEFRIIDEGSGMSAEEVKALGTPFYSLKSKGTGLGLMICFNIVEKYDGKIYYSSLKDKGTTATVCFPVAKD
jgi:two-component system, sporulation sensor kinase B